MQQHFIENKIKKKFYCDLCNFNGCKKYDLEKHYKSKKHYKN